MKVAHHRQAADASISVSIVRVYSIVHSAHHALQRRFGSELRWRRGICNSRIQPNLKHRVAAVSPHSKCDGSAAALERTFLAWMHMAVTLGGVMTALVGFTYTDEDDPDSPYRCAAIIPMRLSNANCPGLLQRIADIISCGDTWSRDTSAVSQQSVLQLGIVIMSHGNAYISAQRSVLSAPLVNWHGGPSANSRRHAVSQHIYKLSRHVRGAGAQ